MDLQEAANFWRAGILSRQHLVDLAEFEIAHGSENELVVQIASVFSTDPVDIDALIMQLASQQLVRIIEDERLNLDEIMKSVCRQITSSEIDPLEGARFISSLRTDNGDSTDNVLIFVNLLDDYEGVDLINKKNRSVDALRDEIRAIARSHR